MAMRVETAIERAATAAERWRRQYSHWEDAYTFSDGTTKGATNDALNSNRHTPQNIARILNKGWAYPQCDCCGDHSDFVVVMKEDWAEDDFSICPKCIDKASLLASQTLPTPKEPT